MDTKRTPPVLVVWMLVTRCFAFPLAVLAWVLHRRMGAEPKRFSERIGRGTLSSKEPVIWFHAASLGEVIQIAPLAEHFAHTEKVKILVTTTTATGAAWVAREMPYATHRFAPIDTSTAVTRFLDGWSISAAIFVEGELWPRLLKELHKRGVPQILLNARHSRTRARFPAVFYNLLSTFSVITCRSSTVAKEMHALGLDAERIHILPDLRLTLPKLAAPSDVLTSLSLSIGARPVWLAASTHPADEEAVLVAQQEVLKNCPDALLILAPRHPSRGIPVQKLSQSKSLTTARRSLGVKISAGTQVYIADTLGELGAFFTLSPIVFMGGSFGREGGHNPYEPAHFETGIVSGTHVRNFADAYKALRLAGAAVEVEDPSQLGVVVARLLRDENAKAMGLAGLAFIGSTKNCKTSYVELIAGVLNRKSQHIDNQKL